MILENNISAILIVKNEEYWLDYTLKVLVDSGMPIYIADYGSTDRTIEIILNYTDIRFYEMGNLDGSDKETDDIKTFLTSLVETPWVLQVSGDEIFIPEMLDNILSINPDESTGGSITYAGLVSRKDGFYVAHTSSQLTIYLKNLGMENLDIESLRTVLNSEQIFHCNSYAPSAFRMNYVQRSRKDSIMTRRMEEFDIEGEQYANEFIDLFSIIGAPRYENPYWEKLYWNKGEKENE